MVEHTFTGFSHRQNPEFSLAVPPLSNHGPEVWGLDVTLPIVMKANIFIESSFFRSGQRDGARSQGPTSFVSC